MKKEILFTPFEEKQEEWYHKHGKCGVSDENHKASKEAVLKLVEKWKSEGKIKKEKT